MAKTGKVIIAKNIKLDKSGKNVLSYTEAQMLSLVQSKAVASGENFSFIKVGKNIIDTSFSYNDCLKCNYMALQNPFYSNKWFFAFIDEVEFINPATTRIHYTIDEFSTWFDYWNPKACFVIREHVNDDSVGANTVPENLETGEYVSCKLQPTISADLETCFCIASSETVYSNYSTLNENLPTGLYYTGVDSLAGVKALLKIFDRQGLGDAVNSVFVIPKAFFSNWQSGGSIDGITVSGNISVSVRFSLNLSEISVTKVNYLGIDYVPRNKKLLSFPYSFLQVSNHSGSVVNYHWEEFNNLLNESTIKFMLGGSLTPGGSFVAYPIDYKNILNNIDEGITLGKYPIGGWNTDVYTNWLTQNGVNIGLSAMSSGLNLVANTMTGNYIGVASDTINIAGTVANVYQHSLIPDQARGNTNVGDFNFSYNHLNLEFKRISIKNEYASICDDFFDRMGYKINRVKIPNQTGRQYWNYVQIGNEECIGYSTNANMSVPSSSMEIINNMYRRGITVWHDHDQLGNYNLTNNIV